MKKQFIEISRRLAYLFLVGFVALSQQIHAQDADKLIKLHLAQGFEESGEWERAAALYEDLYTSEPNNYLYLDGLQRSYTQIKEYAKAIKVIRQWLVQQPRDIGKLTALGGLYYDSGSEATADSVWRLVIALEPGNIQLYRVVANEMMQHRMYDQCIRTYLDGRAKSNNELTFADELGNMYAMLQQFPAATKEYLRLINNGPDQLPYVQSRLSVFTNKPEGLHAATEVVREVLKTSDENITLHRLYAWLLSEDRRYAEALEQYRIIDRGMHAVGNELFNFAQRLHQEHAYKTAADAFKEIIDSDPQSPLRPAARFGYARALEELIAQKDTAGSPAGDRPTYSIIISLYESLVAEYRNPDLVAQSLYRIGVIKFDHLFDLHGALDAFNRIKNMPAATNSMNDALLKIGEIQTAQNDLAGARVQYDLLSRVPIVMVQDLAAFRLAEVNYFDAKFDTALTLLKRFNTNLNTDITNDALQLQYFIQENNTSAPEALTEFAKADLLMRQRKYSESLAQFQDIARRYPTALLLDDAMMKIGELHILLNHPDEAITAFRFVRDSIELSILKDRAQFRIAEIYQTIVKNKLQAIDAYEKLLTQFPNSLYLEESRKRIRMLRGDTL